MSGITTSLLSLAWSLWNWLILDYEEANGQTVRPWAPFLLFPFLWLWVTSGRIMASTWYQTRLNRKENGWKVNESCRSVVNLSFSFRTPSTSWYLLVGVKKTSRPLASWTKGSLDERTIRRKSLPTVETRTLTFDPRLGSCDFPVSYCPLGAFSSFIFNGFSLLLGSTLNNSSICRAGAREAK